MSRTDIKLIAADDRRGLRQFGLTLAVMFPLIFCLLLPWLFGHPRPLWPLYVAAVAGLLAALLPRALYPVYRGWMRIAGVLGVITNTLILTTAFVAIILPLGLVLRMLGKLQYVTGFNPDKNTYRVEQRRKLEASDLENPF